MAQTLVKTEASQIIGGVFERHADAKNARVDFLKAGVLDEDIQLVIQLNEKEQEAICKEALQGRGVAESQALYYERALKEGKTLAVVYNVVDPDLIIDIFDKHRAHYNPNGSRNMRDDVTGMTAGAAVGAIAGAAVGTVLAGPPGAIGGAAAGAALGGGLGAAMGKAAEHRK